MKLISNLLISAPFLVSCATATLVRYDTGEITAQKQNLSRTPQPKKYVVSINREQGNKRDVINLKLEKNDPIKEEWDDVYSKVAVYEKRCKGYMRGTNSGAVGGATDYCKFSTGVFLASHLLLIGFFEDIALPFLDYDQPPIEVRENEDGTITKHESQIVDATSPIDEKKVKLTVDRKTASADVSQGRAQFDLKTLHLVPESMSDRVSASVEFGERPVDISDELNTFIDQEKKNALAQEAERNKPENKYKMKYCTQGLLNAVFTPYGVAIQSNCIHQIPAGPLKVVQAINGGILVGLREGYGPSGKVFFIKTSKQYVDDDPVGNVLVHYVGPMRYTTVLGAEKTIHSFQYLEDTPRPRWLDCERLFRAGELKAGVSIEQCANMP